MTSGSFLWRLVPGVAVAVVVALGLWYVHHVGVIAGRAQVQSQWDAANVAAADAKREDEARMQRVVDGVAAKVAAQLNHLQIINTTITKDIHHDVATVPVYSECRLTSSVFDGLNSLIAATNSLARPDADSPASGDSSVGR